MLRRALVLAVPSLWSFLALSCVASDPPDLRARVSWSLSDPTAAIPAAVDQLSVDIFVEGEDEPLNSLHTVENLDDMDGSGRPELIRGPLDTGVPITIRIQGLAAGAPRYVGHAGPFVLSPGERRYVDLVMYDVNISQAIMTSTIGPRFLHTASPLPDGRVLVAGGFTTANVATACPPEVVAGSRCFVATATREAWIFDPATARFHAVREGGLLEARGGHTATVLSDGRVLVAGGASSMLLTFAPQGAGPAGYQIAMFPRDAAGMLTARATFEIFDPEAALEEEDTDADGDPGRGAFRGSAEDPEEPGLLDRARFLATASAVPGTSRVVIAGGSGDAAGTAPTTFTVFDLQRAGGYGVLPVTTPALAAARAGAGSAAVGSGTSGSVWIVGGNRATSDADLAEVWAPAMMDVAGASASATTAPRMFPQQATGVPASHPEWSLMMPLVAPVDDGDYVVVIGWYGPRCTIVPSPMTPMIVFEGGADPLEQCVPRPSVRNSFTIDVRTGLAQPIPLGTAHAFGAAAQLDDGRVVITGGANSIIFGVTNATTVLSGRVGADGVAQLQATAPTLQRGRILHTSTALPDGGVLTVGGLTFSTADLSIATPIALPEVVYLAPAP